MTPPQELLPSEKADERLVVGIFRNALGMFLDAEFRMTNSTLGILKWEEIWLVWIVIVWLVQVGIDLRVDAGE